VIASPYCLYCEDRVDAGEAVLVLVDGAARSDRRQREGSWVCSRPECLERLSKAAEEEGCSLLRPQGIFDHSPRPDGRPSWLVWISKEKAAAEAEKSGLFSAIYQPYQPTAR
jgi:hypothetical protein